MLANSGKNEKESGTISATAVAETLASPASNTMIEEMNRKMESLATQVSELSTELAQVKAENATLPERIRAMLHEEFRALNSTSPSEAVHHVTPKPGNVLQPFRSESPPPPVAFRSGGKHTPPPLPALFAHSRHLLDIAPTPLQELATTAVTAADSPLTPLPDATGTPADILPSNEKP